MNSELEALFEADQEIRLGRLSQGQTDFSAVEVQELLAQEAQRRQRVTELIAEGALKDTEDYYHAAMIFLHGESVEDFWQAHQLASTAAEMGYHTANADEMGYLPAKWLAAATLDRWLMRQGKPQKYGTQFLFDGKRYRLWDVDPATTDEERAVYSVPSLTDAPKFLEELARQDPHPSMDNSPEWLKELIKRWNQESDVP